MTFKTVFKYAPLSLLFFVIAGAIFLAWPDYGRDFDVDCSIVSGELNNGGECAIVIIPDRSSAQFGGGMRYVEKKLYHLGGYQGEYRPPYPDRFFMPAEPVPVLLMVTLVWLALMIIASKKAAPKA